MMRLRVAFLLPLGFLLSSVGAFGGSFALGQAATVLCGLNLTSDNNVAVAEVRAVYRLLIEESVQGFSGEIWDGLARASDPFTLPEGGPSSLDGLRAGLALLRQGLESLPQGFPMFEQGLREELQTLLRERLQGREEAEQEREKVRETDVVRQILRVPTMRQGSGRLPTWALRNQDGEILIYFPSSTETRLIATDLKNGSTRFESPLPGGDQSSGIALSTDGAVVAAGTTQAQVGLFDATTGASLWEVSLDEAPAPPKKGGFGAILRAIRPPAPQPRRQVEIHSLLARDKGLVVASVRAPEGPRVFAIRGPQSKILIRAKSRLVSFSPDGRYLVSHSTLDSQPDEVWITDLDTGQIKLRIPESVEPELSLLGVMPDGGSAIFSKKSDPGAIYLQRVDWSVPRVLDPVRIPFPQGQRILSYEGSRFLGFQYAGGMGLLDLETQETRLFPGHEGSRPLVSPDGSWLAACFARDGLGRVFFRELRALEDEELSFVPNPNRPWPAERASFSRDGRHFVVVSTLAQHPTELVVYEVPRWR